MCHFDRVEGVLPERQLRPADAPPGGQVCSPRRCGVAGRALDKTRSKNPLTWQFVDDSRRIIKHFNKPDAAKVGMVSVGEMGAVYF